jgi:hypothetical protein
VSDTPALTVALIRAKANSAECEPSQGLNFVLPQHPQPTVDAAREAEGRGVAVHGRSRHSRFYVMLRRALSINPAVASLSLTCATVALCGRVLRLLPRMGPCAPAASLASLALLCAQPAAVEDLVRTTFRLPCRRDGSLIGRGCFLKAFVWRDV